MSQRAYYISLGVDCKNLWWEIAIIKNIHYHVKKLRLNHSYYPHWEPGPWIAVQDLQHYIIPSVFVTHILAFANSCCRSWDEFYFPDHSGQVNQFTAIIFQWKIHGCNESQRSWQLFCHISQIQICNTTWDKAGDMPSMVTAIIAAGRNWTLDYNAGQACDVVIKVSTCIRTAWNRVRNTFATVLTTITIIWRPGLTWVFEWRQNSWDLVIEISHALRSVCI